MKVSVNTPAVPAPTVTLELRLPEFVALLALHTAHGGGGPNGTRGDIEDGLNKALLDLPDPWCTRASSVVNGSSMSEEYPYDYVTARREELGA